MCSARQPLKDEDSNNNHCLALPHIASHFLLSTTARHNLSCVGGLKALSKYESFKVFLCVAAQGRADNEWSS